MQIFKLPQSSAELPTLINRIRQESDNKLSAFCSNQILEKGLSTKTFKYDFDMGGTRSGSQRKSVQKLREILFKYVKKQLLYLDYVKGGDMVTLDGRYNNRVSIRVESPYIRTTFTRSNQSVDTLGKESKWYKSLTRYCRYLKYKAIRNGIPIVLTPDVSVEAHPEDQEKRENWTASKGPFVMRLKLTGRIAVSLSMFRYDPYARAAERKTLPEGIDTYAKYEVMLASNPDHAEELKRYKNPDSWTFHDIGSRYRSNNFPGAERYLVAEKAFLVLDEMIQVMKTLSRRVQYDTSAFDIGSI